MTLAESLLGLTRDHAICLGFGLFISTDIERRAGFSATAEPLVCQIPVYNSVV